MGWGFLVPVYGANSKAAA